MFAPPKQFTGFEFLVLSAEKQLHTKKLKN